MTDTKRYALLHPACRSDLRDVQDYLPSNYTATLVVRFYCKNDPDIVIMGHDRDGWTLDGYVLPRLGSALIAAYEVDKRKALGVSYALPDRCIEEVQS